MTGRRPVWIGPPDIEGAGVHQPQPAAPLPLGYIEEEHLVAGSATRYDGVRTPDDGSWVVAPAGHADYRTRVIVRRPIDSSAFSGTVLVEWFNVSAVESAPDWGYLSEAIGRDGHAYVGVSAQAQGVEGGDTLYETADGVSGLRSVDADRYGGLRHPGDAYSFDIFTQVGRALGTAPDVLLGGLAPARVIAMGESQSSMFLTTLINAVHPVDPVFDGYLVHSRGATVAALDGSYARNSGRPAAAGQLRGVRVRTDPGVPVMIVEAETDLITLGYVHARQGDTELIRTWEVAGTAHADSETLRAVIGGPRDPSVGELLGCGQVNSGPHKEVLRAAASHLVDWAAGGPPPPVGNQIRVDTSGTEPVIVRDVDGIALGGVRNPMVDVPSATLTGDPAPGSDGLCLLFGATRPFPPALLVERYGDADSYLAQFRASADTAVAAGFLLAADADALVADMERVRTMFG